jgi:hypothetical protein
MSSRRSKRRNEQNTKKSKNYEERFYDHIGARNPAGVFGSP